MAWDLNIPGNGGTGATADNSVRFCHNCEYAGNLDPREYPGCDQRCPRCGVPWKQRPWWKGPETDDGGVLDVDALNGIF